MAIDIMNLVSYLGVAAMTYKSEYKKAVETRKAEEKELEQNYVKNTKLYGERQGAIKTKFDKAIAQARTEAAEFCLPHFEALKEHEHDNVARINETVLNKIGLLKDISVTEDEMRILAERYGTDGDYWTNRVLSEIAEKNGISPRVAGLQPSYGSKMGIITQLEDQLSNLLINWNPEERHSFEKEVLLSEDVLARAVDIYLGGLDEENDKDAARAAYVKIKAGGSQIERGLLIKNVMHNMKGDRRNELLYRLSQDADITDLSFQLSGYENEILQWKNGKASLYADAVKAVDGVGKVTDTDIIKDAIAQHSNNEFFMSMLERESRKNAVLKNVLHPEETNDSTVVAE